MYFDLSTLAETVAVGRTSAMSENLRMPDMQTAASDAFGNYTKKGKAAPSPINTMNKNRMQTAASKAFGNYTKNSNATPNSISYAAQNGKRG